METFDAETLLLIRRASAPFSREGARDRHHGNQTHLFLEPHETNASDLAEVLRSAHGSVDG